MSIDAMKQALAALNDYEPNEAHKVATALRAAIEQAQGLAEKIPAKGTVLEQTLRRVWDEMPHTAVMDALIGGTGVMLGDKRIDPASIYKQPEQEPVAWVCYGSASDEKHTIDYRQEDIDAIPVGTMLYTAPPQRQWQGLTDEEVSKLIDNEIGFNSCWGPEEQFARAIEAKLKKKNND